MGIFKKRKEEKKRKEIIEALKYVVPVVLALLIFLIVKFGILGRKYSIEKIDLPKYTELVKGNKQSLIYITTNDCDTCSSTEALIKKVLQGSSIKTYEIKLDDLSDEDLNTFMEMQDVTKDGVVSPSFMLVKDGTVESSLMWPFEEDGFIDYLKENKLVEEK